MGPHAHEAQLKKTLSYFEAGRQDGAELVAGGNRIQSGELAAGYFVEPTVFANVTNQMRIAREEIFGPVASLIPFELWEMLHRPPGHRLPLFATFVVNAAIVAYLVLFIRRQQKQAHG